MNEFDKVPSNQAAIERQADDLLARFEYLISRFQKIEKLCALLLDAQK